MQRTLAALALALLSSCRPPAVPMVEVLAANAEVAAGAAMEPGSVRHVRVPAAASLGLMRPADEASLKTLRPRIPLQAGDPLRPELFQAAPPPASATVPRKGRRFTFPMSGAESLRENDHIDMLMYVTDQATHEGMALTIAQNVVVLGAGEATGGMRPVSVALRVDEGETALLAAHAGSLQAVRRNPEDIDVQEERGRATLQTLLTGERIDTLMKKRMALEKPRPARPAAPEPAAPTPAPAPTAEREWDKPAPSGPLAPTIEILDR